MIKRKEGLPNLLELILELFFDPSFQSKHAVFQHFGVRFSICMQLTLLLEEVSVFVRLLLLVNDVEMREELFLELIIADGGCWDGKTVATNFLFELEDVADVEHHVHFLSSDASRGLQLLKNSVIQNILSQDVTSAREVKGRPCILRSPVHPFEAKSEQLLYSIAVVVLAEAFFLAVDWACAILFAASR